MQAVFCSFLLCCESRLKILIAFDLPATRPMLPVQLWEASPRFYTDFVDIQSVKLNVFFEW